MSVEVLHYADLHIAVGLLPPGGHSIRRGSLLEAETVSVVPLVSLLHLRAAQLRMAECQFVLDLLLARVVAWTAIHFPADPQRQLASNHLLLIRPEGEEVPEQAMLQVQDAELQRRMNMQVLD